MTGGPVNQANRGQVNRVDLDQRVDHAAGDGRPRDAARKGLPGVVRVGQHRRVDKSHDEKRRTDHVGVLTPADDRRDRHARSGQSGRDEALAQYVVCGRGALAQRRAAQHVSLARLVGEGKGKVRPPAGHQLDRGERRGETD